MFSSSEEVYMSMNRQATNGVGVYKAATVAFGSKYSLRKVSRKKIQMSDHRITSRIADFHKLDMYFLHASAAWRANKREIFAEAGSSGLFEYLPTYQTVLPETSRIDNELILDVKDAYRSISAAEVVVLADERRNTYRKSTQCSPSKVPKELASINEQTQIPIYMDSLPRPPRKCRIITS